MPPCVPFAASGSERMLRATGDRKPHAARQRELVMCSPKAGFVLLSMSWKPSASPCGSIPTPPCRAAGAFLSRSFHLGWLWQPSECGYSMMKALQHYYYGTILVVGSSASYARRTALKSAGTRKLLVVAAICGFSRKPCHRQRCAEHGLAPMAPAGAGPIRRVLTCLIPRKRTCAL